MALGGVSNKSCFLDTITQTFMSPVIDVSATGKNTQLLMYDPRRNWVIRSIRPVYVTENPATTADTINIGTQADTDAFVANATTSITATKGDVGSAFTLATTLASTKHDRSEGFPVLTAGTAMIYSNAGGGGNGEIVLVVEAFPEDTTSMT